MLGASLLGGGCADDPVKELEEHRQEWLAKHPQDYVVEICGTGLSCCCSLNAVSGGQVVASRSKLRGQDYKDGPIAGEPIATLFDQVAREVSSDNCDLEALQFDAKYSYVSDYYCSSGEEGGGAKVTCFQPDTTDLTACSP